MTAMRWGAWLNALMGVLLVAAPFGLGYYTVSEIATYEAVVVGLLIGGLALWSALSTTAPAYLDYMLAVLGGWSVIAPFVFGYHATVEAARNADVALGLIVAAVSLVSHFYPTLVPRHRAAA